MSKIPQTLWVMNHTRVRAGQGPMEIDRISPSYIPRNGVNVLFGYYGRPVCNKGKDTLYSTEECFETEEAAKQEGLRIARAEIINEEAKHNALMSRIRSAQDLCSRVAP